MTWLTAVTPYETCWIEVYEGGGVRTPCDPSPTPPAQEPPKGGLWASAGTVMRTAVFNLPEGDASLTYPALLSEESLNLLGHYLHLVIQQAQWAKKAAPVLYGTETAREQKA